MCQLEGFLIFTTNYNKKKKNLHKGYLWTIEELQHLPQFSYCHTLQYIYTHILKVSLQEKPSTIPQNSIYTKDVS